MLGVGVSTTVIFNKSVKHLGLMNYRPREFVSGWGQILCSQSKQCLNPHRHYRNVRYKFPHPSRWMDQVSMLQ